MIVCRVCGTKLEEPVKEWELGAWALTYVKEYECCDKKFREYATKPKERINKKINKTKTQT